MKKLLPLLCIGALIALPGCCCKRAAQPKKAATTKKAPVRKKAAAKKRKPAKKLKAKKPKKHAHIALQPAEDIFA